MLDFIKESKLLENDERFATAYNNELEADEYPLSEMIKDEIREEGKHDTLIGIIKNMLKKGKDYNEISDILNLSVSEVKEYVKML